MGSKKKEVLLSIANSQRVCAHSYYVLCRYVCACAPIIWFLEVRKFGTLLLDFCPLFVLRLFGSLDFCPLFVLPIGNLDWIFVLFSFLDYLEVRLFGSLDFCPIGSLDWIFVLFSFLDYLEVRLFGSLDFCPLFVLRLFGSDYLVLRSSEVWNSPIFLDYLVDYLWFLDYFGFRLFGS